ncbi:MAG: hypothetical protein E5V79_06895, partial [Mesorhizobium sp.]
SCMKQGGDAYWAGPSSSRLSAMIGSCHGVSRYTCGSTRYICIHDAARRLWGMFQSRQDVVAAHKIPTFHVVVLRREVDEMNEARHHVVVVGAGFGGLELTRALAGAPVRITMI